MQGFFRKKEYKEWHKTHTEKYDAYDKPCVKKQETINATHKETKSPKPYQPNEYDKEESIFIRLRSKLRRIKNKIILSAYRYVNGTYNDRDSHLNSMNGIVDMDYLKSCLSYLEDFNDLDGSNDCNGFGIDKHSQFDNKKDSKVEQKDITSDIDDDINYRTLGTIPRTIISLVLSFMYLLLFKLSLSLHIDLAIMLALMYLLIFFVISFIQ